MWGIPRIPHVLPPSFFFFLPPFTSEAMRLLVLGCLACVSVSAFTMPPPILSKGIGIERRAKTAMPTHLLTQERVHSSAALHAKGDVDADMGDIGGIGRGIVLMGVVLAGIAFLFQQPYDVRHLAICPYSEANMANHAVKEYEEADCVHFSKWVSIVFGGEPIPEGTRLQYPMGQDQQIEALERLGIK